MAGQKAKTIRVDPKFYDKIERARQRFMKKRGLTRLTTVAFTGVLETKLIQRKNEQKRRRK